MCSGSQMTVRDGGTQNCQSVQEASNNIKAVRDTGNKVSLKNSF